MKSGELKYFVSDIETPQEYYLFGGRFLDTGEVVAFHINAWRNDLYAMVRWIEAHPEIWYVGFNFYGFDAQVIQFIIRHHEEWHELSNLEICARIAQFGADTIDDGKYDIQPRVRIDKLSFKICDLFKIHHFDNTQNRASLKWLEIMMDMPNVAEMPIHHSRKNLTQDECQMIYDYWLVDLDATAEFLRVSLGQTELELYKGKNMIQERLDVAERYGFRIVEALNWSDTKMGEQISMYKFCKSKKVKVEEVYEMKKSRKPTRTFTFGKCIPAYVSFQTPEFQQFHNKMKDTKVLMAKVEYPFSYNGTRYTIAKGGLHSIDPRRIIDVPPGFRLVDIDLSSQYPGTLVRRLLYPSHLGPEWCGDTLETMAERIACKKQSKKVTDPAVKAELEGRAEYLKKSLNAGRYGMTGQVDSWQYDPFVMYSCTIGNEFEMLMLIESLELKGIHCISANTDGLTVFYEDHLDATFHEICDEWEKKIMLPIVDGEMQGRLEYTEYVRLVQEHVNCYIATKKGVTKPKVKGRFAHEVFLNKNNMKDITRIQRMAIQNYFNSGMPVEQTVRECKDIFKFVFGYKSGAYEFIATDKAGTSSSLGHLVRCYASCKGVHLSKSKEEDDNSAADEMQVIKGSPVTIYNQHQEKSFDQYDVAYQFYIDGADMIIRGIEASRYTGFRKVKKPLPKPPPEQTSMF